MKAWIYAATISREVTDNGSPTFLVRFPDFPEAFTEGATPESAREEAIDALAAVAQAYVARARPLPAPRDMADGEFPVPLDPAVAARALLAQAMADQGLSKIALAQRMGRDEKAVRRILSGSNASLELTLQALRVLGLRPALAA